MSVWQGLLRKLGLEGAAAGRAPLRVFLLDDDVLRHEWFAAKFKRDQLDIAVEPVRAVELLSAGSYDAIFLDHDLLPRHYKRQEEPDDAHTGYAVAAWLAERPGAHPTASVFVHTRNADGAMRMVELMRRAGRTAEYVPYPYLGDKIKQHFRR